MIDPALTDPALLVAWCALAIFCGGLIKGALGVGTPLLTVPMLALVLVPQSSVAMMAMPVVAANVWQAGRSVSDRTALTDYWQTAVGILLGTVIGTYYLSIINGRLLLLLVGFFVLCFTALQFGSVKATLPARFIKMVGFIAGMSAGIVGGISSMFGPLLIIYLLSVPGLQKDAFVNIISVLYLFAVIPWAAQLYLHGILTNELLFWSTMGILPLMAGLLLGQSLRAHISEAAFRRAILIILVVSGCSMLAKAGLTQAVWAN